MLAEEMAAIAFAKYFPCQGGSASVSLERVCGLGWSSVTLAAKCGACGELVIVRGLDLHKAQRMAARVHEAGSAHVLEGNGEG